MLQPWALVSLNDAKSFLRYHDNDEDATIERMIHAATLHAEKYTGRQFIIREIVDEEHYGDGRKTLVLLRSPIVNVSRVLVDDVEISSDEYEVLKSLGRIRYAPTRLSTPIGYKNFDDQSGVWTNNAIIKVTYTAGYCQNVEEAQYVIPDVVQGVLISVAYWFTNRESLQSESLAGSGSTTWTPVLTSFDLWRQYRRNEGI